jgi:hypothetical protein
MATAALSNLRLYQIMNPDIAPDEGCDCPAILWGSIYTGRRMRTPIRPWAYPERLLRSPTSNAEVQKAPYSVRHSMFGVSISANGRCRCLYLFRTSTMSSAFQVAVNE